jgi:hypothetical protein
MSHYYESINQKKLGKFPFLANLFFLAIVLFFSASSQITADTDCQTGCTDGADGGQCVSYVRTYSETIWGKYLDPIGVFSPNDICAYNAWGNWDLGFGSGTVPKSNSIMVLAKKSEPYSLPCGHVAIVVKATKITDTTYELTCNESNWGLPKDNEKVSCCATYHYTKDESGNISVTRENGTVSYPLHGFIYNEDPSDYFWSGNGSIINFHGKDIFAGPVYPPFGVTKDVIIIRPNEENEGSNPVGYFQWQVNPSGCGKVKIDAPLSGFHPFDTQLLQAAENHVDITIGEWNDRSPDKTVRDVSLPFIVDLDRIFQTNPTAGNYWMIQIAFKNKVTTTFRLTAKCTEESSTSVTTESGNPVSYGEQHWAGCGSILSYTFRGVDANLPDSQIPNGTHLDYVYVHSYYTQPVAFFQWNVWKSLPVLTLTATDQNQKIANVFVRTWDSRGLSQGVKEKVYVVNADQFKIRLSDLESDWGEVKNNEWLQVKVSLMYEGVSTSISAKATVN